MWIRAARKYVILNEEAGLYFDINYTEECYCLKYYPRKYKVNGKSKTRYYICG